MLDRIKESIGGGGVGGECALAPAVSCCLFAHEYDEGGGVRGYFNLQMSRQVSTSAALVYFQG